MTAIRQRTLGIDLASDPKKTGVCEIAWSGGEAVVERLWIGADDNELVAAVEGVDAIGIDAPFGWPRTFLRMTTGDDDVLREPWTGDRRNRLRFRRTDFLVRERVGWWPLSVSSDLIAVPAMRCIGLLHRLGVADKSGDGRVFETYPAAALAVWGLPAKGYKGPEKTARLESLVTELERAAPWLKAGRHRRLMVDRDDAFDAVVAALMARAAAIGESVRPGADELEDARLEGWIHVPMTGSLARLNRRRRTAAETVRSRDPRSRRSTP